MNRKILTCIALASEERLMILSRQIHVVVREGLLVGGPVKSLILRTPEQINRIAPDFTLRDILLVRGTAGAVQARVVAVISAVTSADPRRDMIQGHLLDERGAVFPEVPPLEDQNQAGDEGRGAGERDVELWG